MNRCREQGDRKLSAEKGKRGRGAEEQAYTSRHLPSAPFLHFSPALV